MHEYEITLILKTESEISAEQIIGEAMDDYRKNYKADVTEFIKKVKEI